MLTIEKVRSMGACSNALKWGEKIWDGKEDSEISVMKKLMKNKKHSWANWLIARLLSRDNKTRYAIFAAEQVIGIYEKKYPNDDRPRKAIEAAKAVLSGNGTLAAEAAEAAEAARAAARVAEAAWAAARAAEAAARAARVAAWAAEAAAWAAEAARVAAWAAEAAARVAADKEKMQIKILEYGIKLLREEK